MTQVMDPNFFKNIGRHARNAVAQAYLDIGGQQEFSEWAKNNQKEFYTQLWIKLIPREVELGVTSTVEELLDAMLKEDPEILDLTAEEVEPPAFLEDAPPALLHPVLTPATEEPEPTPVQSTLENYDPWKSDVDMA